MITIRNSECANPILYPIVIKNKKVAVAKNNQANQATLKASIVNLISQLDPEDNTFSHVCLSVYKSIPADIE